MSVWARVLQAQLSLVHCVQGQGGTRFSYRILETEKLVDLTHPTHWTGPVELGNGACCGSLFTSSTHPSIHLLTYPTTHPCTHLSIHLPPTQLSNLSTHPSTHPLTHPSIHSRMHSSIHPHTQLSICSVIHLPIYPSRCEGTMYLPFLSKKPPVP